MSAMNIDQYVNPEFDRYHRFLVQQFKQGSGRRANNLPLGASQTQKVLSSASNQLTERKIWKSDSYKTVMCQSWLVSAVCPFAENCRFAHGEEELRPMRTAPQQNGKYKTKLCEKYTTTGICPYGDRCLFIHPVTDSYKRPSSCSMFEQTASSSADEHTANPTHPQNRASSSTKSEHIDATTSQHAANLTSGFGPIGSRPHPSWPLESPSFYRRNSCDESVTPFSSSASSGVSSNSSEISSCSTNSRQNFYRYLYSE